MLYPNKAESGQIRMLVRFGKGMQAVAPKDSALLWTGQLVLGENGIGTLKRTQIDQMVNGRRIELTFGVENDAFRFSSTTRTQDMADQLKLIATKLEYPGWDSAPVERGKAVVKSGYGSFEMSASSVLQRDLEYLLTNGDLRWKTPLPADVDKVTAAQVQKFWQPLLASGPIEIMLFGDFETDQAIAALANSFGAMKPRSAATVPAGADTLRFPAALQKPIALTHKGPADQAAAVIAWPTAGGKARISESRELELLAAIFRDRLFEKFRAEQAASYSPDMANNWPEEFDSGGYLMAYSQVRPEDVPRFFAFADAVAKDLVSTPVSDDELKRAVEPIKQNIERASSGNTFWLNQLKGASFDPGKFASLSHLYTDFASVTPARLQQLAKTYFDNSKAWKLTVTPAVKTVAAKK
jgi:zinc protease